MKEGGEKQFPGGKLEYARSDVCVLSQYFYSPFAFHVMLEKLAAASDCSVESLYQTAPGFLQGVL